MGELMAGQRLHQGDLAGLTSDEWLERWGGLRHRQVPIWVDGVNEALARHRVCVEEDEAAGGWAMALAHLDALVEAEPGPRRPAHAARAVARPGWPVAERRRRVPHRPGDDRAARRKPRSTATGGGRSLPGRPPPPFPPESSTDPAQPVGVASAAAGEAVERRWRPVPVGSDGHVDLARFSHAEHISAYVLAHAFAGARKAALLVGSDDGVRVWLNGALVLEDGSEHAAAGQHCVPASLRERCNVLLAKVVNAGSNHDCTCGSPRSRRTCVGPSASRSGRGGHPRIPRPRPAPPDDPRRRYDWP